jgi:hypothetical protein
VGERGVLSTRFASNLSGEDLRRVTALPADPDVVDGALRLIVELARISIRGADGVSVSLKRHGVLSTVAASDQTILAMDADQYSTGQGPCVDASVKGQSEPSTSTRARRKASRSKIKRRLLSLPNRPR